MRRFAFQRTKSLIKFSFNSRHSPSHQIRSLQVGDASSRAATQPCYQRFRLLLALLAPLSVLAMNPNMAVRLLPQLEAQQHLKQEMGARAEWVSAYMALLPGWEIIPRIFPSD